MDDDFKALARAYIVQKLHEEKNWLEVTDFTYGFREAIENTLEAMITDGTLVHPIRDHYTLPEYKY